MANDSLQSSKTLGTIFCTYKRNCCTNSLVQQLHLTMRFADVECIPPPDFGCGSNSDLKREAWYFVVPPKS